MEVGGGGFEWFFASDVGDDVVAFALQEEGVGGGGGEVGFGGSVYLGLGFRIGFVVVFDDGPAFGSDDDGEQVAFLFQFACSGVKTEIDDAHGTEFEIHLHGAVLDGEAVAEGTNVLVTGFFCGVERAFNEAKAASIGIPALGHGGAREGLFQK